MVVTEQSSNLSMLSPSLWVYRPTTVVPIPIGSVSSTAYGATVSYTVSGVQAGQTYLIREFGNSAGDPTGGFGLEVNFGSASQPPIPPPNTVVLQQPNQGGGVSDVIVQALTAPQIITIGDLSEPGDVYLMNAPRSPSANTLPVQSLSAGATQAGTTDAVTPLVALATAQPGLPAGKSAVAPAAAGQARSSSPGSTPSGLQAVDATILGWKVRNPLSEFTKGNTKGLSLVG